MGEIMKKRQSRKPTANELKIAVSNMLVDMDYLKQYIYRVDSALAGYVKYKNETEEFKTWLIEQDKEYQNEKRRKESAENQSTTKDKPTIKKI